MPIIELRCGNKKHGEIVGDNVIEVKCNSRFCGARSGVIILHTFSSLTGELLSTQEYKDARSGNV